MADVPPMPAVPDDVELTQGSFTNAQGLKLATYCYVAKEATPRGIVFLLHGYGAHTQFEWLLPPSPGEPHTKFEGTVVEGCVRAGLAVHTVDHQSHGRSEGASGMRAYFEKFSHLGDEASDYIEKDLVTNEKWKGLPIFLWSVSMGGATAVTMARKNPETYAGLIFYAPMISLEIVRQQEVMAGIKNAHLEPIAGILSYLLPTVPLAKAAKNTVHPKAQEEFDNDPLNYTGDCRNRVGEQFLSTTSEFLGGGLKELKTPLITYHSCRDTFTDPLGSEKLIEMAAVSDDDKTYMKVGKDLDIEADIWHALACEPGHEKIRTHALDWIEKRITPK